MKRNIIAGLLTLWLGGAVLAAAAMKQALPALNGFGMTYVGLTWPAAIACHESDLCETVPPPRYSQYFFTV